MGKIAFRVIWRDFKYCFILETMSRNPRTTTPKSTTAQPPTPKAVRTRPKQPIPTQETLISQWAKHNTVWGVIGLIGSAIAALLPNVIASAVLFGVAWVIISVAIYRSSFFINKTKTIEFILKTLLVLVIATGFYFTWSNLQSTKSGNKSISELTNAELKRVVFDYTDELYDFDRRTRSVYPADFSREKFEELQTAKSIKEEQKIARMYNDRELRLSREWWEQRQAEYNKNYLPKTETLKIELFKRIPPEKLEGNRPPFFRNLAGAQPLAQMAADFQRLANMLD